MAGTRDAAISVLRWTLKGLAQLALWRYRPGIVGVTGSVGKTSTKLAIAAVLGAARTVRVSHGNLNNELGLPLTVLGDWSEEELRLISREEPAGSRRVLKLFFWFKVVVVSAASLLFGNRSSYPEILILEYGADRPGDLGYLLSIARPNIAVITAIGDIPVHVEFYKGPDEVAREKARLIESISPSGFAVLNYDDPRVMKLADRTRGHIITYGFRQGAEIRLRSFKNYRIGDRPGGAVFAVEYGGIKTRVQLPGTFGKSQAYVAGAAVAVGVAFGFPLGQVLGALKERYVPPPRRLRLLRGVKDTFILDDSYNASPLSMKVALETLRDLPGKRKIAVLGDMFEIGPYAMEAHREVGKLVAGVADVLFAVGPRAKFIALGARKAGMRRGTIKLFDAAEEAQKPVQDLLRKGDLVLVKASRAMRLDEIVEEIRNLV